MQVTDKFSNLFLKIRKHITPPKLSETLETVSTQTSVNDEHDELAVQLGVEDQGRTVSGSMRCICNS